MYGSIIIEVDTSDLEDLNNVKQIRTVRIVYETKERRFKREAALPFKILANVK